LKMRTGVALGSNLGDRMANLRGARQAVLDLPDVSPPILASAVYETDPVDCEPGAGKFLNAVIEFDYNGDPRTLLKKLGRIEESLGRRSVHERNVSRNIDLDLLYCDDLRIDDTRLKLPHPRMHLRKFVLQPLHDVRPDLILPGLATTVDQLLAQFDESVKVNRLIENW